MCLTVRMQNGEVLETQADLRRYCPVLDDWAFRSSDGLRFVRPEDCLCDVNVVTTLNRAGYNVRPSREDVFDFEQV